MADTNDLRSGEQHLSRFEISIVVILLALGLFINLSSLVQYPMPHCDEAGNASAAYTLWTTGTAAFDMVGQWKTEFVFEGRDYTRIMGAFLAVLGRSLLTVRLISVVGFLIAAAMTYLSADKLFGRQTAVISLLAYAGSFNTFWASHVARKDIWVVAAIMTSVALYSIIRRHQSRRNWLYYLALGVFVLRFPAEMHPIGMFLSLGLSLAILIEQVRSPEGRLNLLWYCVGGTLGVGLILLVNLGLHPLARLAAVSSTTESACGSAFCVGGSQGIFTWVWSRLTGFGVWLKTVYILDFNGIVIGFTVYAMLGIAAALKQRSAEDWLLITTILTSLALYFLAVTHRNPFYAPLWDGFFAILIGSAILQVAEKIQVQLESMRFTPSSTLVALTLVLPLVAVNLAGQGWLSVKFHQRDFNAYQDAVRSYVPADSRVVGDAIFWFSLGDRNDFVSNWVLSMSQENITVDILNPDYVVDVGALSCEVVPSLRAEEFITDIHENCQLVGLIEDRFFGTYGQAGQGVPTEIYACSTP